MFTLILSELARPLFQHALFLDFPARRQRAELLWTQIKDTVESLCREPSIHALGLMGSMAWGMPPAPGQAIELFVIATPRQGDSAEAAVRLAAGTVRSGVVWRPAMMAIG